MRIKLRFVSASREDHHVTNYSPEIEALILEGAVVVKMMKPRFCKTFEDYAQIVKLKTCSRRGQGIKRRVQADSAIPGNLESFLRIDDHKTELFIYLAEQLSTFKATDDKNVISTLRMEVVCNGPSKDTSQISPCNHEEADARIMLHVKDLHQHINRTAYQAGDTQKRWNVGTFLDNLINYSKLLSLMLNSSDVDAKVKIAAEDVATAQLYVNSLPPTSKTKSREEPTKLKRIASVNISSHCI
ncbi:hypothetical protein DPMN_088912 [Dreissena polymorpha]|uniref:Uncharacterized protein n=1 Tax=Dreissena polymorpha TaxID=45954 RepID=A0A9D4KVS7_DREPO|nr:hypothetical protein DPMN_088912 [Dreissena polymorpha]